MSRLLFAAARDARVQREIELLSGKFHWENVGIQWGLDDELRIHPDDLHLQYGPISTAIRKSAEAPRGHDGTWSVPNGQYWLRTDDWLSWDERRGDELHRSLFLLILSEALADEGL